MVLYKFRIIDAELAGIHPAGYRCCPIRMTTG